MEGGWEASRVVAISIFQNVGISFPSPIYFPINVLNIMSAWKDLSNQLVFCVYSADRYIIMNVGARTSLHTFKIELLLMNILVQYVPFPKIFVNESTSALCEFRMPWSLYIMWNMHDII